MSLTKYVQGLYEENYKGVKKDIKEDCKFSRWLLHVMDRKIEYFQYDSFQLNL